MMRPMSIVGAPVRWAARDNVRASATFPLWLGRVATMWARIRAPVSARSPTMSAALCRTNSSGQRSVPPFIKVRSSRTMALGADAPLMRPLPLSPSTPLAKPNVRAGASGLAGLGRRTGPVRRGGRRAPASFGVGRPARRGAPPKSPRRNGPPGPAGAGRKDASVSAPVCSPRPDTAVRCRTDRLLMGLLLAPNQRFEVVHDLCQPDQRPLGAQELALAGGRLPRHRRPGGGIAVHAPLLRPP